MRQGEPKTDQQLARAIHAVLVRNKTLSERASLSLSDEPVHRSEVVPYHPRFLDPEPCRQSARTASLRSREMETAPSIPWFAATRDIKCEQNLAGLAPKGCFISAEPVERVVRQIGETQRRNASHANRSRRLTKCAKDSGHYRITRGEGRASVDPPRRAAKLYSG